jgi:hypothetical protein
VAAEASSSPSRLGGVRDGAEADRRRSDARRVDLAVEALCRVGVAALRPRGALGCLGSPPSAGGSCGGGGELQLVDGGAAAPRR